jgi:hypothetical protein
MTMMTRMMTRMIVMRTRIAMMRKGRKLRHLRLYTRLQ